MDWSAIFTTAISAGIGTAIIETGFKIWESRSKKSSQASYLALRIAISLETFAGTIGERISNYDLFVQSGGHAGTAHQHLMLPEVPIYPADDEGWRSLKRSLAASALAFPNIIADKVRLMADKFEFEDEEDANHFERLAHRDLALHALDVASKLRSHYRLPSTSNALSDYLSRIN